VIPGQTESDKDKLLLFQEKEQLLRELRSITPHTRTQQDMKKIQCEIRRLEQDLNNAFELSNKTITDRVRLHEEKQLLLQQLRDALRLVISRYRMLIIFNLFLKYIYIINYLLC
jgi:protein KIBRA